MPLDLVHVVAPSRLHFGMFSFGQPGVRAFGGLGVMLDRPGVVVTARSSSTWQFCGDLPQRSEWFARRWAEQTPGAAPAALEVQCAPDHLGLGTGTQLGLAVGAALTILRGEPRLPSDGPSAPGRFTPDMAISLARQLGRGQRSAVGIHGFALGGLIIESGKLLTAASRDEISPLAAHVTLPPGWRFVLVRPPSGTGLAGEQERAAFERLPPVPPGLSADLLRTAMAGVLPAAERGDFPAFAAAIEEFGALAGECFAPVQGGSFANPSVAETAERLRAGGGVGVAQSSWGPTVAAVTPSEAAAQSLASALRSSAPALHIEIAAPSPAGACWQVGLGAEKTG